MYVAMASRIHAAGPMNTLACKLVGVVLTYKLSSGSQPGSKGH